MINITVNNKKIAVPTSWNEVTVKQYRELQLCKDVNPVKILSIFTGIAYEVLMNFDCKLFETDIMPAMYFIGKNVDLSKYPVPDRITIGDKAVKIPKDIKQETFGQKIMLQMEINKAIEGNKDFSELISFALATYLAPEYHKKEKAYYDDKQAAELMPLIDECKIVDCYPAAAFFLRRWIKSSKMKKQN